MKLTIPKLNFLFFSIPAFTISISVYKVKNYSPTFGDDDDIFFHSVY